jgi:hypothetical protein
MCDSRPSHALTASRSATVNRPSRRAGIPSHRICKPPAHYTPITGHKFDSAYLESIDGKRHNIVHSGNLGQQLHEVETDLKYLRDTANYFLALINYKYGIRLNPALMFGQKNP